MATKMVAAWSAGYALHRCIGSALKNNVVQAGLLFDVVLFLPSISRSRCLIDTEILQTHLKHKFLTGRSKLHFR